MSNQNPAFRLKGNLFTLTVMQLQKTDVDAFRDTLSTLIAKAPNFFKQAPMVLDCDRLTKLNVTPDFEGFCGVLREHGLIPVGARNVAEAHQNLVKAAGLALFPSEREDNPATSPTGSTQRPLEAITAERQEGQRPAAGQTTLAPAAEAEADVAVAAEQAPAQATATTTGGSTKVITKPIRSGQQVYARGGDLVVLSTVSPGAELLADGNIHVYGALRGRALAGIQGNTAARIFANELDAELISIAGRYLLRDALEEKSQELQHVQVYLENEGLHIRPL